MKLEVFYLGMAILRKRLLSKDYSLEDKTKEKAENRLQRL